MIIVKVCKIHGDLVEQDVQQGVYKGKKYKKCKLCELDRSRRYHAEKYQDEEWVKEKHERDRQRWIEKKDEITEKRQQPEARLKRRETYQKYYEAGHREYCKEKQKVYRETLHDSYVKKCIQDGDKSLRMADIPQSMIELKRSIMMLKKGVRQQQIMTKEVKIYESNEHGTIKKPRP